MPVHRIQTTGDDAAAFIDAVQRLESEGEQVIGFQLVAKGDWLILTATRGIERR